MAVPTWVTGQVLASSDVNTWFVPLAVVKPGDTSRTSNTTLAADPDLTLAIAANATYEFFCYLYYEGGTQGSSDIKWTWTVPSGAFLKYQAVNTATSGTAYTSAQASAPNTASTTVIAGTNGAGNPFNATMTGILQVGSTAGSLTLNWAQNTSSGTSTIVHGQSALRLRRIG